MTLYKFTSINVGRTILQDRRIRFSQPPALNDPFDSMPFVAEFVSEDQLASYVQSLGGEPQVVYTFLDEMLARKYKELSPIQQSQFSLEDWVAYGTPKLKARFQQEVDQTGLPFLEALKKQFADNRENNRRTTEQCLQAAISSTLGILSLSTVCDHSLLWAHYADSHRGLALAFDSDHSFFADAREVKYVGARIPISFAEILNSEEKAREAATAMVFTKHLDWAYEHEYRMVRSLDAAQTQDGVDPNGYSICLFDFPASCVVSVVMGSRATIEDSQSIKSILADDSYRHVKLACASCEPLGYGVKISLTAA